MAGKALARLGDKHSGHSCYPPSVSVTASNNVVVNGKGAVRVGDSYVPHCCGPSCHQPVQSGGSGSVYINNMPAARVGDKTACGAAIMVGSTNVIVG